MLVCVLTPLGRLELAWAGEHNIHAEDVEAVLLLLRRQIGQLQALHLLLELIDRIVALDLDRELPRSPVTCTNLGR